MRRMHPTGALMVVLALTIVATISAASPAKVAGRATTITPPVTTVGQAATAELLMDQTPREVVSAVNDESNGACLANIDTTTNPMIIQIGTVRDVGKTDDPLGTVAEASVNNRMRTGIDTLDAHGGCINDTGKAAALLLETLTALAIPIRSTDYTDRNVMTAADIRNASYRSGENGVRPRR